MAPTPGETPRTDWPVLAIAGQSLIVRWTFYAQWYLSKRNVDALELQSILQIMVRNGAAQLAGIATKEKLPANTTDVLLESFAGAVSQNYTEKGIAAPTAEEFARIVSLSPDPMDLWGKMAKALWTAILKAQPAAAAPTQQNTATEGQRAN